MQVQAIYQSGKFIPLSPIQLEETGEPVLLKIITVKKPVQPVNELALQLQAILGQSGKKRPAATKTEDREALVNILQGKRNV